MFYIQFNEVVSIGNHGMMFFLFFYTRITHGKPTIEHQHKNTFKAMMVFILKTDGWINIHFRFCLELIMFFFVFYILKQQYSQICKIFILIRFNGSFYARDKWYHHLAWNTRYVMHAKPEMVFYYNKRKL